MRMVRLNAIIDSVWSDRLTGTTAADYVELTWGNDTIYGGAGDDVIWDLDGHYQNAFPGNPGDPIWLASDDKIYGGTGNDLVFTGWGADSLYGGGGYDTLDYRYSKSAVEVNLILGRGYGDERSASRGDVFSGFEAFRGSSYADLFFLSSNDVTITAGNGNDSLYGGSGFGMVYGGEGNDLFMAGSGDFDFFGGEGYDTLSFALSTTRRTVTISADDSIEQINGSAYGDILRAAGENYSVITLRGEGGHDSLSILGYGSTAGASGRLYGGTGNDVLNGAGLADRLYGDSGEDVLNGGSGNDRLYGGSGHDRLSGGGDGDYLYGGSGNDRLSAGPGDGDRLYGGTGDDVLEAGWGSVILFGEGGADTFVFQSAAVRDSQRIADFQAGIDEIDISLFDARRSEGDINPAFAGDQAFVFMGLAGRSAPAGTVDYIHSGNDTVVRLFIDSDGIADHQIVLSGLHTLTADDFVL